MGYRYKLGFLDKEKHNIIKDMTVKQLKNWYGNEDVPCYKLTKEVYNLGKNYYDNFLKKYAKDVFTKKATNKYYKVDNDFYIISKEGFEVIIEQYRKNVLEYYESLLKFDPIWDDVNIDKAKQAIEKKIKTWGENCTEFKLYPYEMKNEQITNAWEYEYAIFELVRLYKSVDWDKQLVTITAW